MEELKILGLTDGEVKVYTAILNLGISTINKVHEKTGLERRGIYDIINKLIRKGLVTYTIEKGKRTFQCAPPSKLRSKLNEKKAELKKFEDALPDIEKVYKSSKPNIGLEVFRGKEGIKSVLEDMLNYKKNYFIGGGFYLMNLLPHYWPQYNKRRIKKGVKRYSLIKHELKGKQKPDEELLFVKYLPEEMGGSPAVIFVYGDKVVNVLWSGDFFAFMVESKEIAASYKKYFQYLWKNVGKK